MPIEDYLTIKEAADRLRIHPGTVKRLCREGDIPAIKVGHTWLINPTKLEVFAGVYQPKRGGKRKLL